MAEKKNFQQKLEDYSDGIVKSFKYDRLKIWKEIFFHPTKTFGEQNEKADLKRGAKDVFITALPVLLIGFVFILLYLGLFAAYGALFVAIQPAFASLYALGIVGAIIGIILYFLSPVIWWLINSVVQYVTAKILGGRANFRQHAYMAALATASQTAFAIPFVLAGIIPCVGYIVQPIAMLIGFYGIYLTFSGTRTIHKIDSFRSAIVALIPIILLIVLVILIYVLFFAGIMAAIAASKAAGSVA